MAAIAELGEPWSWVFAVLRDHGVRVTYEPLWRNVGGFFAPEPNLVVLSDRYTSSDPKAVAAALIHEASHARDYYGGEPIGTLEGCYQTEIRAYHTQAEAWLRFYGPGGKQPAMDELDRSLNDVLRIYSNDRGRIERVVRQTYSQQCTRIASK